MLGPHATRHSRRNRLSPFRTDRSARLIFFSGAGIPEPQREATQAPAQGSGQTSGAGASTARKAPAGPGLAVPLFSSTEPPKIAHCGSPAPNCTESDVDASDHLAVSSMSVRHSSAPELPWSFTTEKAPSVERFANIPAATTSPEASIATACARSWRTVAGSVPASTAGRPPRDHAARGRRSPRALPPPGHCRLATQWAIIAASPAARRFQGVGTTR